jgi:hypothetical protein
LPEVISLTTAASAAWTHTGDGTDRRHTGRHAMPWKRHNHVPDRSNPNLLRAGRTHGIDTVPHQLSMLAMLLERDGARRPAPTTWPRSDEPAALTFSRALRTVAPAGRLPHQHWASPAPIAAEQRSSSGALTVDLDRVAAYLAATRRTGAVPKAMVIPTTCAATIDLVGLRRLVEGYGIPLIEDGPHGRAVPSGNLQPSSGRWPRSASVGGEGGELPFMSESDRNRHRAALRALTACGRPHDPA